MIQKVFIYAAILLFGMIGRKLGAFRREHTKLLNTIICYLTLPAALVVGFQGVTLTPLLLIGLALGLFTNGLLLLLGLLVSKKKAPYDRAVFVFNTNCFNIGSFAIPFLSGAVSPDGFAAICVFDISVALMCYGVNVAVGNALLGGDGKVRVFAVVKKIFTSPVVITYCILFLLAFLKVSLPAPIMELAGIIGGANSFLAMLSVGILFQVKLQKKQWLTVATLLPLRVGVLLLIAAGVFWLLPLPRDMKFALCVILMAPCAGTAPSLTEAAGGDGECAAVINSISIPISMLLMTAMVALLG